MARWLAVIICAVGLVGCSPKDETTHEHRPNLKVGDKVKMIDGLDDHVWYVKRILSDGDVCIVRKYDFGDKDLTMLTTEILPEALLFKIFWETNDSSHKNCIWVIP